jgi:plastocyanin
MVIHLLSRRWLLLVAALSVAASGTCLAGGAATPKAATHTATIEGSKFDRSNLTVTAGDTIVWVNKDPFPHTATSKDGTFNSQSIAAGQSWKYTASKKGSFAYTCTFHPTMRGGLRVN